MVLEDQNIYLTYHKGLGPSALRLWNLPCIFQQLPLYQGLCDACVPGTGGTGCTWWLGHRHRTARVVPRVLHNRHLLLRSAVTGACTFWTSWLGSAVEEWAACAQNRIPSCTLDRERQTGFLLVLGQVHLVTSGSTVEHHRHKGSPCRQSRSV